MNKPTNKPTNFTCIQWAIKPDFGRWEATFRSIEDPNVYYHAIDYCGKAGFKCGDDSFATVGELITKLEQRTKVFWTDKNGGPVPNNIRKHTLNPDIGIPKSVPIRRNGRNLK